MDKISTVQLGDLIEFQRGYDLPKSEFKSGTVPVISSNGILGYHNEVKVKAPGITIGRSGTVGIPHYITTDFFPHNTSLFVKNFKGNNTKYIFYLLKNLKLNDRKSGSGVPTMNRNHLHPLKIKAYTNTIDQQKIASVLSSLDKKIELNNKINKELEAMAKTLYDYWFVQFDFPDVNGKPYKSSGGKMVYNEELKREIPNEWEVKKIASLIGNHKGGDWGKEQQVGNYTQKVSCARGADIKGLNGNGELNPPVRFILEKNSNKILEANDIIVEISGGSPTQSTGRLAFIIDETLKRFENPLVCSNFCKSFSLQDSKLLYFFIYTWNILYDNGVLFGWEGKTSGIKNLLFDSFTEGYSIVVPDKEINDLFFQKVHTLHQMKQKNLQQNEELSNLRDWLLPMLMNGQVKVK